MDNNRPFEISRSFRVQTYDIDVAGIVSNIVYIRWLEDLRLLFMEQIYPLPDLFNDGFSAVLRSTQIDYKHPICIFDQVTGTIWLHELTRMRWCLAAEIRTNGGIASVSKQSGVFVNRLTLELVPIPPRLRDGLTRTEHS